MKIQNVKGGYDFLPSEQKIRNYINDVLEETFIEYGYKSIETPILCYYDMLAGKYDESNDLLNEIYKLTDQGKRKLGLRYDLTVPFAKFIALNKNKLKLPFKRYEISKVFRDGPVKVGRDREFTQCDVDVVGIDNQMIEAELLSLYVRAFKKLDIPIVIKYNSRNLMCGLLEQCGIVGNLFSSVVTIIDKKNKLEEKDFENELLLVGLDKKQVFDLKLYFSYTLEELINKFKDTKSNLLKKGLDELISLTEYLKFLGIDDVVEFDSSLARGQDYYTGNVFEVYETMGRLSCSIGGGGRYDNMITDFIDDGNKYPAVGISFGLTSLYILLKDRENLVKKVFTDVYIVSLGVDNISLQLADQLRDLGLAVEVDMLNRRVSKAFEYCDKENIPYIIVLGEDEVKSKRFKVKRMVDKVEYDIYFDKLEELKSLL